MTDSKNHSPDGISLQGRLFQPASPTDLIRAFIANDEAAVRAFYQRLMDARVVWGQACNLFFDSETTMRYNVSRSQKEGTTWRSAVDGNHPGPEVCDARTRLGKSIDT
jgi:hypothetical protein